MAETFDYVIVGAGSAGCILANRLTADGRSTVCLLEAGPPDSDPAIRVPAMVGKAIANPRNGWGYTTVPQAHDDGRQLPVPRGRDDDAFFAPLAALKLRPETELYVGCIHYTDGLDGTKRRRATAAKHAKNFGLATECGFGRRDPATIPALLALHAASAKA